MAIPSCKLLTVTNADYADCNGRYEFQPALKTTWAPEKPVFKRLGQGGVNDRYIFWTKGKGFGNRWVLGGVVELTSSGSYYHISKAHNNLI